MENDKLSQIWKSQNNNLTLDAPENIIHKAKKQRKGQWITIAVLSITVIILLLFTTKFVNSWNHFTFGLMLMISSLVFRLIIELITMYRKESQLIVLDSPSFQQYLKKHYKIRLTINYIITPICFAIYIYGFTTLLPYFKQEFSKGFYSYILVSGFISLFVIAVIIIKTIVKERAFLKQLRSKKNRIKSTKHNLN